MLLDIHELGLVIPAAFATVLAPPLWAVVALLAESKVTSREGARQAAVFLCAIGALIAVGSLLWDPYLSWLAD
jgi:hypothetical protein